MSPRDFLKLLAPLNRRVRMLIARGVVQLVNDALKIQGIQLNLLDGETLDGVERFQDYGLTSRPKPGAEAIAVAIGANRNHAVIIAVDDRRYRLTGLAEGEVALYDDLGSKVHLKRGGEVHVVASTKVRSESPLTECTGNLKVDGNAQIAGNLTVGGTLSVTGASTFTALAAFNGGATIGGIPFGTHKHPGVTVGPGQTGVPV